MVMLPVLETLKILRLPRCCAAIPGACRCRPASRDCAHEDSMSQLESSKVLQVQTLYLRSQHDTPSPKPFDGAVSLPVLLCLPTASMSDHGSAPVQNTRRQACGTILSAQCGLGISCRQICKQRKTKHKRPCREAAATLNNRKWAL